MRWPLGSIKPMMRGQSLSLLLMSPCPSRSLSLCLSVSLSPLLSLCIPLLLDVSPCLSIPLFHSSLSVSHPPLPPPLSLSLFISLYPFFSLSFTHSQLHDRTLQPPSAQTKHCVCKKIQKKQAPDENEHLSCLCGTSGSNCQAWHGMAYQPGISVWHLCPAESGSQFHPAQLVPPLLHLLAYFLNRRRLKISHPPTYTANFHFQSLAAPEYPKNCQVTFCSIAVGEMAKAS